MRKTPRLLVTCTRCHRLHRMRDFDCVHPMCPRCALPRASARARERRVLARGAVR
jgi:hypothetical protein